MVSGSLPNSPLLKVGVAPLTQRADAGGEVVFLITIENASREAQTQSLSIQGVPEAWYSIDFDARRRVFPNEQRSAPLLIRVPQDAAAGDISFQVVVTAGAAETGVVCMLEVLGREQPVRGITPPPEPEAPAPTPVVAEATPLPPVPGLTLAPSEVTWRSGSTEPAKLKVTVRNVGSADTEYALFVEGLQAAWCKLPATLRVPARQALDTELEIQPSARARLNSYTFGVIAVVEGFREIKAEASAQLTIAAREQAPRTQRTQRVVSPVTAAPTPAPSQPAAAPVLPPEVSLAPRSTFRFGEGEVAAQATVSVQNRSRLIERYQVSVDGIPEEWYSLGMNELRLEPGGSMQIPLRLTPRTGAAFPAGNYEFRIRVAPHSFPDSFAEVGGVLAISGVTSFDARLTPIQTAGRKEKFKLTLQNTGGLPLSPWVEATDPAGMCTFKYDPPQNLEVGQETVVPIWVGAKRNGFAGEAKTFDFRIRVSPAGGASTATRSFDARFVHEPFLSKNLFKYSVVAMLIASIIGLFLSFGTSSISRAATVVKCGLDDSYQEGDKGQVLIKPECGGALAPLQKGAAVGPSPTAGPGSPTVAPQPTRTPAPNVCTPDPALGLAVGKAVVLRADARIREQPGTQGKDTGQRGNNRPGTIIGGPQCSNNLVWWEVDSGVVKGWTAEQDENKVQLITLR